MEDMGRAMGVYMDTTEQRQQSCETRAAKPIRADQHCPAIVVAHARGQKRNASGTAPIRLTFCGLSAITFLITSA